MTEKEMPELEPCPFCGQEVAELLERVLASHPFYVACLRCGVKTVMHKTKGQAIAAWNTRADLVEASTSEDAAHALDVLYVHACSNKTPTPKALIYVEEQKETIRKALTAQEAQEWQPIETAPKDGSKVILYFVPNEVHAPHKAQIAVGYHKRCQFKNAATGDVGKPFYVWQSDENLGGMSYAPTHWMPLPQPPKKEGE